MNTQTHFKSLRVTVFSLVLALLIALFVNTFITEAAIVEHGPSMQPSLYVGYRVMTEKLSYLVREPARGDIVIVERRHHEVDLVKRVVGLPWDMVEVRAGHVFINGEQLAEPYVQAFGGPNYGPAQIPEGYVFVLGDNRSISHDSRLMGPVKLNAIYRRVLLIYWPMEEFKVFP